MRRPDDYDGVHPLSEEIPVPIEGRLPAVVDPDAADRLTMATERTVLVVVHTITAWNRFQDVLPVFDSDRRIQLVFTFPDAAVISPDLKQYLAAAGAVVVPWEQALRTRFDLALSAHHSGPLQRIQAPLAVLSHGMGYTKYSTGSREPGAGSREPGAGSRDTYGLSAPWLVRDGELIAKAIVLSHTEQLDRLRSAVPEAATAAIVAGDPCFDRLLASTHNRVRYREALGIDDDRTLVTISSTWGPRSLFGSRPDLVASLTAELDLDSYTLALVLHPNIWYAHGAAQIKLWLGDCLRSGLRLIPPDRGWQQTILASDVLIGDNGAVSGYAAAVGVPTVLGAFEYQDVVPTSAIDALGRTARRIDRRRPFPEQLAVHVTDARQQSPVRTLVSSEPGMASARLRIAFYRMMALEPPTSPAPTPPYSPADLSPIGTAATTWWASVTGSTENSYHVRRWPSEPEARRDQEPNRVRRHLLAATDEPRPDLSGLAAIQVADEVLTSAQLREVFDRHPACSMIAVPGPVCRVVRRDGAELLLRTDTGDPLPAVSVLYAELSRGMSWLDLPTTFDVRLGHRMLHAEIVRHSSAR
ncbi:hypothetical protein ACFV9C_13675 [Kribbella sp. NPDC059898]|uniref:hypothetical protein n=1 Tax=Kribbella sp. NPDC059898 TaxID=3346995 RepID=UPI003667D7EC